MKHIIAILLLLAGCNAVFAQSQKKYIKAAEEAIEAKNYYAALVNYRTALDFDTARVDLHYQLAESARMYGAYNTASQHYTYVLNSAEAKAYPETKFWLGNVKRSLGKYAEAITLFQEYVADNPNDAALQERATRKIASCEWAAKSTDNSNKGSSIEHLGTHVNTPYSDFAPLAVADTLWYSSYRFEDNSKLQGHTSKVLTSVKGTEGEVMQAIDSKEMVGHTAFNAAQNRIYYTLCDYNENNVIVCEIYSRTRTATGWSNAMRLSDDINTKGATTTQPSIGKDIETGVEYLFFVSDRAGGKGKLDVWMAPLNNDGTPLAPIHVAGINTPEDEMSPFYHGPTKTLYFSSMGYEHSFGGFDIYKTKKMGANTWGEVEPGGYPLNSSHNDLYYTLNEEGTVAYFASNRLSSKQIDEENKVCCNDIYRENIVVLNLLALTFNKSSNEPLKGCTVQLIEISNRDVETKINTDGNDFHFRLDTEKRYKVVATKENFQPDTIEFSTADLKDLAEIKKNLYLTPKKTELEVFTFNANDRQALAGCRVRLLEQESGKELFRKENPDENDFKFQLDPCKKYIIIAERDGYRPDTVRVTADCRGNKMKQDMYLTPVRPLGRLADYLPLPLYFDNDEPERRTMSRTTTKSYPDTYFPYYARKSEFLEKGTEGVVSAEREQLRTEIEQFFERSVKRNFDGFMKFSDWLLTYLEQGETVEIVFQGYASPRAASAYNDALGDRRAKSIRNHFDTYKDGAFKKYFASGKLRVTEVSYGSRTAPSTVVGTLSDERNSIYSVPASKERRVEIIEAKPLNK